MLKRCTACLLVKYCSVDCQRAHRKQHKKACKKRASEMKDELMYGQGHERPEGDFCLICTLPIPFPIVSHSDVYVCCMKRICHGCTLEVEQRGMNACPFCRTTNPENNASAIAMVHKRIDAGDAEAMTYLGAIYYGGFYGLEKDINKAIELWSQAAELGSSEAHVRLGGSYNTGKGVEKDEGRAAFHWERAAMMGCGLGRTSLGIIENDKGNEHLATKHFLISAKMGHENSLHMVKKMFMGGHATKAQYAEALKGYGDAAEEMKSPQREEAKGVMENRRKEMLAKRNG